MAKVAYKAPDMLSVDEARKQVAGEFTVEEIDLAQVDIQYPHEDTNTFFVNGHLADKHHVKSLCTRAGLPIDTVLAMSPGLRRSAFSELMKGKAKLLLNGKIIHVLNDEASYVPYSRIFDALVDATGATGVEISEDKDFYMNFVTGDVADAGKGDIIRSGVSFRSDSDGGIQNLSLGPFCYRLVCSNGMIGIENAMTSIAHSGEDAAIQKLIEQAGAMASISRERLVPSFIGLKGTEVKDAVSFMHSYLEEMSIGSKNHHALLDAAQTLENPTAFDIINLVTNYANGVKPSHRNRLQMLGGNMVVAETESIRCPKCHRDMTALASARGSRG